MSYRFALIGCGRIGQRHADLITQFGQLIAIADPDSEKMRQFAGRYSCNGYADAQLLLAGEHPDIAVICTPNGLHPGHTISALKAGSHVLCEKPMAIDVADCEAMISAAETAGKRLFVVKQNRYNPPVQFVKTLLDAKKLGELSAFQLNCFWNRPASYFKDPWRGTLDLDGGTLFTQFSHFIDLMGWFFGEIEEVHGIRQNFNHRGNIAFEDAGVAHLRMSSGVIGTLNYTINVYPKNMEGSLTIFGEKGTVKIGGPYLNNIEYFDVEHESLPELAPSNPSNKYASYEGSMNNHESVYREMLNAINTDESSAVEAREAMRSVAMIRKIYEFSPLWNDNNRP